jgi:4-hydroxy-2-oxoheptanedioate aldolase
MNALLKAWRDGQVTFGIWSTIDSGFVAEVLGDEQFDYICCDQQHGVIDYSVLLQMLQGIRASRGTAITRVLSNDPGQIMKSLDAGAQGVIVPMVNDTAEAARAVAACKYPPEGSRSYGPVRASVVTGSRDPDELRNVACAVMVETAEGLKNADDIAGTPGVDAIYVGPADLSIALGLPPGFDRPERVFKEAIATVLEACRRNGVVAGIQCTSGEMAQRYAELGFQMITVASDANLLRSAARSQLARARGHEATSVAGGYS